MLFGLVRVSVRPVVAVVSVRGWSSQPFVAMAMTQCRLQIQARPELREPAVGPLHNTLPFRPNRCCLAAARDDDGERELCDALLTSPEYVPDSAPP